MNDMIDGTIDNKNIGLLKSLWRLRQALDVYCLIAANADIISIGGNYFEFQRSSCLHLITIDICKIYEKEKLVGGKVKYELDSIEGVLRQLNDEQPKVLDAVRINDYVRKYSQGRSEDGTISSLSQTIENIKAKYKEELVRFETFRHKLAAHRESSFNPSDLPSYEIMERLFNIGQDFYMLVSRAFISVIPYSLNDDRRIKTSLMKVFEKLGFENIRTEMV